jgi:hypothetical protein
MVTVAAVLFLFVPRLFILVQLRKHLSPEQVVILERLKTEPLDFSGAWSIEDTDPPELTALVEKNHDLLIGGFPSVPERILERIFANESLSEEEWTTIGETIDAASTPLHSVTTLISHPGYRMGILPLPKDAANLPDYTALQRLGLLFLLQARFTEHATNDLREALPYALTALQLTVRKNSSPLMNHLIAIALQLRLTKTIAHFAANCQDVEILKGTLAEMIRLAPLTELEVFEDPVRLIVTDTVQAENALGGTLKLLPGKPGIYYIEQLCRPESHYGRQRFPGSPNSWAGKAYRMAAPVFGFWGVPDMMAAMVIPNTSEGRQREQVASAELSLARLTLATRIRELDGQEGTGDTAAFTPDLLPENPVDPFTNRAYLWSASDGVFFSVGPDEVSQNNRLRYSPTNGTLSAGDISLP